jgi:hypothetical protein
VGHRPAAIEGVVLLLAAGLACDRSRMPDGGAPGPGQPFAPPALVEATCEVRSTPSDAGLFLDGEPLGLRTPAVVKVWAGRQSAISVRAPGYLPGTQVVDPDRHQRLTLDFELRPGVILEVVTTPPGAEVRVDGGLVLAATPGRSEAFEPGGPFAVTLHKDGHVDVLRTVAAPVAGVVALEQVLVPAATVHVASWPTGAQVLVDGKPTTFVTPAAVTVTPGAAHQITVTRPGWTTVTRVVKVGGAGSQAELGVILADLERLELDRRLAKAEAGLARARKALQAAQAREDASELRGVTRPALVRALDRAYDALHEAQNELDEAEAGRDHYDALHPEATAP